MQTKPWAAMLMIFTTLLTSTAQILWKFGIKDLQFNIVSILTNYFFMGGILLYIIGGVLMIISFRGGEVSVLYPIVATSYVWVSLMSLFILKEQVSLFRWLGVFTIMAGIVFIGFGSKASSEGAV